MISITTFIAFLSDGRNVKARHASDEPRSGAGGETVVSKVIWFNISVIYSAIAAGWATSANGRLRAGLVCLAVHGGLWSIYRALDLIQWEANQ